MSKTRFQDKNFAIPKSATQRIFELNQSLRIINDSIELIEKGSNHQILVLYGQLRSILTEKAKATKALLFDVSEILKKPLEIYYQPLSEIPIDQEKIIFQTMVIDISTKRSNRKQHLIDLKNFLDVTALKYNGRAYSIRNLIDLLANKMGGSHYSSKIPKKDSELISLGIFGVKEMIKAGIPNFEILNSIILSVSKCIFELGSDLIRRCVQFEFYLQLYIPDQKVDSETFLIDLFSEDGSLRVALFLDRDLKICILITDFLGRTFSLNTEVMSSTDSFSTMALFLSVDEKLQTRIDLFLDKLKVFSFSIVQIFLFLNEFRSFKMYLNRSREKDKNGLTFGLSKMYLISDNITLWERGKMQFYLDEALDPKSKLAWFTKDNFGVSDMPFRDIKMEGEVLHQTVSEFMGN